MSRSGFSTTGDYLGNTSGALITTVPLTIAGWTWRPSNASANMMHLHQGGVAGNRQGFYLAQDSTGRLQTFTADGSGSNNSRTTDTFSTSTWHHVCGRWASSTSRISYMDGSPATENTTSRTPSGIDRTFVGIRDNAGGPNTNAFNGYLAEFGVWDVALSADEISVLATGYSPLLVRPESLVAYFPLIGRNSPEIDLAGAYGLTISGSLSAQPHPRIIMPRRKQIIVPVSAGADVLLADDVESTSEVTSPALAQGQVLLANDVESTSEVSSPALAQGQVLLADDVESASEVTSPALAQGHMLLANDNESASEVTTPALTQGQALLADDAESASEVSTPSLTQGQALLANDNESASEVSTPALVDVASGDDLLADDVESTSELSEPRAYGQLRGRDRGYIRRHRASLAEIEEERRRLNALRRRKAELEAREKYLRWKTARPELKAEMDGYTPPPVAVPIRVKPSLKVVQRNERRVAELSKVEARLETVDNQIMELIRKRRNRDAVVALLLAS